MQVAPGEQAGNAQALMALQQKRKITRMIMVVVLLFALCWLPLQIFNIWFRLDKTFPRNRATYTFKVFAHTLSYANSCVNPFVYAFLGENFRRYFRKAFPFCFKKKDRQPNSTRTEQIAVGLVRQRSLETGRAGTERSQNRSEAIR